MFKYWSPGNPPGHTQIYIYVCIYIYIHDKCMHIYIIIYIYICMEIDAWQILMYINAMLGGCMSPSGQTFATGHGERLMQYGIDALLPGPRF